MIKNNQTYQMRMCCFNVKKSKEFHELWRISTDFFFFQRGVLRNEKNKEKKITNRITWRNVWSRAGQHDRALLDSASTVWRYCRQVDRRGCNPSIASKLTATLWRWSMLATSCL